MAEEDDKDVVASLGRIETALSNYKQDETTGTAGWIAAGLAVLVALISIVVLAFQAFQAGKERAKLLHEAAVREEEAHQKTVDATLEVHQDAIDAALAEAATEGQKVEELKTKALDIENNRVRVAAQINTILSWDQVDQLL